MNNNKCFTLEMMIIRFVCYDLIMCLGRAIKLMCKRENERVRESRLIHQYNFFVMCWFNPVQWGETTTNHHSTTNHHRTTSVLHQYSLFIAMKHFFYSVVYNFRMIGRHSYMHSIFMITMFSQTCISKFTICNLF